MKVSIFCKFSILNVNVLRKNKQKLFLFVIDDRKRARSLEDINRKKKNKRDPIFDVLISSKLIR